MRQKLINDNQENLVNSPCNNCIVLRNAAWPSEYHVRNYVLSTEPKSPCQFKCIYCYAGHYGNNDFETKKSSDKAIDKRVDLLLELEKRGLADPAFTVISLSDGEIAVDPKRANLYKLIERYKSWIYTNAGIYSEEIAVLLKKGLTHIVVSIDAGTPETFTKVKGIDAYIKVCENLKKYAAIAPRLVRLQYIYLPNRNDDIKDIDGFVELCDNINPEMVSVLLDVLSDKNTLDMKVLLGFFDLLDKLLLHGHSLFIGANVFLSNEERDIILDFAKNKADGLIRDEQYYHRLKLALNEKVY
jgi:pyruvate-formate lyase-activating enzyme